MDSKHGMSGTPEYQCYLNALARCRNSNRPDYANYGGRGIQFRFDSFTEFFLEIGFRPSQGHSIERINNDGHYEPGNIRWATRLEQNRHKRNVKLDGAKVREIRSAYAGGNTTQTELAKRFGVSQPNIGYIVRNEKWPLSVAA